MARRPALPGVDRRQQILEAALAVIAEHGFEGATTKEVAARADVTHGLIYFYFKDKEDLFAAACQHKAACFLGDLDLVSAFSSGEPVETALRCVIMRIVLSLAEPTSMSLLRVMMRTSAYEQGCTAVGEAGRECARSIGRGLAMEVCSYLNTQVSCGALRITDTMLASRMLVMTIVHLMIRRSLGDENLAHYAPEELASSISTLLLHGLLSTPDSTDLALSKR